MKRTLRRKLQDLGAAICLLIVLIAGWLVYVGRPGYGLPFHARFTPDVKDRWTALGGVWEVADGSMRNDSNDRGAKLLIGSPNWKDYTVEGDLQLFGNGSAGLLARVSDAEVGENSYKGYLAGVRSADNSLFLGVFDFAYHEASRVPLPQPVRLFCWYHVRLKVNGCRIDASVSGPGIPEVNTVPLNDPDCFRSGVIGLRSNGTGGVWRNVVVAPANSEGSFSLGSSRDLPASPAPGLVRSARQAPDAQSVRSLQYLAPFGSTKATVRGYRGSHQTGDLHRRFDGRVQIQTSDAVPLKIGDTVEVTGEVNLDRFSPVIRNAQIRLLSESVPIPPAVLTANQLASGTYDGTFVQVEGYLSSTSVGKDGSLILYMDAGTQLFRVLLPAGRSRSRLRDIAVDEPAAHKGHLRGRPAFRYRRGPVCGSGALG